MTGTVFLAHEKGPGTHSSEPDCPSARGRGGGGSRRRQDLAETLL